MKYWSNSQAGDYAAITENKLPEVAGRLSTVWDVVGVRNSWRKLNCPMSKYEKSIETKVKLSKT